MAKWGWIKGIVLVFIVLFHVGDIRAEEPFLIVTHPWPPYILEVDGNIIGVDAEITRAVFRQLGMAVNIQFYPWKRCLMMVKHQNADAILSASITLERKEFLYFSEKSISEGITVFFIKTGSTIPFTTLKDLNGLRVGTVLGYSYCAELDHSEFIQHAEQVSSLEMNFKKLLADRLDVVVEVDKVGYLTAKQMEILDQITVIPNAAYCKGGNYIAFSKKSGYKQLSTQFSHALKAFKTTDAYKKILKAYGLDVEYGREKNRQN